MKKIVAKEFLILLSVIVISLLTFVFTYGYNLVLSYKKNKFEDSISNNFYLWNSNIQSLRLSYDKKFEVQNNVYNRARNFYSNVGEGRDIKTQSQFWNILMNENLKTFNDELNNRRSFWVELSYWNDYRIYDFISFRNFLIDNTIEENEQKDYETSIANQNHRTNIQKKIYDLIEKMLSKKEQIKIALNTFYILFTIAFILRFLLISIRWSIKELKS